MCIDLRQTETKMIIESFYTYGITHLTVENASFLSGYHGDRPAAVQAWRTCPLGETSPSRPIL